MESGEQEKDKQKSSTTENQDNMAATSKFALFAVLFKFNVILSEYFCCLSAASRIDVLSRAKPVPVGFIEDR